MHDCTFKSVMKSADVSKLFLAIFERTYDGLYLYASFFVAHSMSLSKATAGGESLHSPPKKSPKKPNQKWVKCCMKIPVR